MQANLLYYRYNTPLCQARTVVGGVRILTIHLNDLLTVTAIERPMRMKCLGLEI